MAKIKDVAKLAGVSTATVSHVINNTRFVGDDTRKKVLAAIASTGYEPNIYARNLSSRNSWDVSPAGVAVIETPPPDAPKIYLELSEAILRGDYTPGEPLPDNPALMRRFGLPHLAVNQALRELQGQGLIELRADARWYIQRAEAPATHLFGLLIPGLGQTEIFEPICQGMARAGRAGGHALLWGDTTHNSENQSQQVLDLCEYYISRNVSGIFFAPLELSQEKDNINQWVVQALEKAGIPIVLLDRGLYSYPRRSRFDLVGIDNRRAGYILAEHLIQHGCKKLGFLAVPHSAPTVEARIAGFRDALEANGLGRGAGVVHFGYPNELPAIRQFLDTCQPDGLVCGNDMTAAILLRTLDKMRLKVPQDIKLAGVDDVKYAGLLSVPLTTLHQPCLAIGEVAVTTMLDRIAHPDLPAREIQLDFQLVIRDSCGCQPEHNAVNGDEFAAGQGATTYTLQEKE